MANAASTDRISRDENGPDYAGALKKIEAIMATEERAAKARGPIKGLFDDIDGFRVDRGAAMQMKAILKMEPENRTIHIRSLFGLFLAAKDSLEMPGDLVDLMHKATPEHLHVETPGQVLPKARGRKSNVTPFPGTDIKTPTIDADDEPPAGDEPGDEPLPDVNDKGAPMADDEWDGGPPKEEENPGAKIPDVLDTPEADD